MPSVSILGLCWDASSSYARGAALAPPVILTQLRDEASNSFSTSGVDVESTIAEESLPELGDDPEICRARIETAVAGVLERELVPLSLGGDHSVTLPILRAIKKKHGSVDVVHVDAHPDLYDEFNGDRFSHACPFARALEEGCIGRLVQIGLRSISPDQRATAARHGVVMLGADEADAAPADVLDAPLYLSIDLDGFDPAFAPGVSHPEPGGLTSREGLALIERINGRLLGADIVELNPLRDPQLLTAGLAARLAKELAAKIEAQR
ncbi:MAG: agmatinase [Parvularculaceae bacterium]